ncbi:hypothetical protein M2447_000991 [Ereboglobus sp. PH5-10]|uniref:hypothetical protein n=1 Tax=Ereboglobus sp. PH5-10 TaxID=2940629 RepID=UPI002406145C|nr:hypothetical protein [Ereboglobus sp. PH5-10]MDF9826906.1 hypothetical protein [Ereboglobus sp. PH5-10]
MKTFIAMFGIGVVELCGSLFSAPEMDRTDEIFNRAGFPEMRIESVAEGRIMPSRERCFFARSQKKVVLGGVLGKCTVRESNMDGRDERWTVAPVEIIPKKSSRISLLLDAGKSNELNDLPCEWSVDDPLIDWVSRRTPVAFVSRVDAFFRRAILNRSTAPNFVLITVVNDNTNEARVVCVEAPFLLGAIHRENNIPYSDEGVRKALDLALANKDQVFHFSNQEALANINPHYGDVILDAMRVVLKDIPDSALKNGFRGHGSDLDNLYMRQEGEKYSAYRNAIAHVLLERGLLPGRGCFAGHLFIAE